MLTSIAMTVLSLLGTNYSAQAQGPAQIAAPTASSAALPSIIPMRALPDVRFDTWIQALARAGKSTQEGSEVFPSDINKLALQSSSYRKLYAELLVSVRQTELKNVDAYTALAKALFDARREVRLSTALSINERYARMTLLEFLGEETLFMANRKFPEQIGLYVRTYAGLPEGVSSAMATTDLKGIEVTSGDIVLSKFSGSGSSSFIALLSERPSIYSHAATVYVDPVTKKPLSPEAFIEDGVRLRSMQGSYIDTPKTRMFVFRANRENTAERMTKAAAGVNDFVEEMFRRTSDPTLRSAFDYNFSMEPGRKDAFSCVETVLESYRRGGLTDFFNPYPSELWGKFDEKHREIFAKFLEINAPRFPSPGDLDMNVNFDLAAFSLDVSKLGQERAEMAALDAVFTLVAKNHLKVRESLKAFDNVGSNRVTPEQLAYLSQLPFIPAEMRGKLSKEVPPNINLKQLVFFGYLNQVFTPELRTALLAEAENFEAKRGRPPGLNELRSLAARHAVAHFDALLRKMMKMAKDFQNR
jgi:hypothetical protein